MRKFRRILMILILLLLTACGRVTEEEARQALHNNLLKRYGEEFNIGYMGRRSRGDKEWYQANISPVKYNGTPKETDAYYKSHGNVNIKKGIFGEKIGYVGDLYRLVLFNESANEFYLPKLKELFGENVLPVLEIDSSRVSKTPEFLSNPKFLPEYKKRLEDGSLPFLKGGIYIFGRVENDEDREWYRKQIYEFVQFMKQTGTFEYVDLDIEVIDERILTDEFQKLKSLQEKLLINRNKWENENISTEIYRVTKKELLKNIKVNSNDITKKLDYINKGKIKENSLDWSYYNLLLYTKIYSPKYIKSNSLNEEKIKKYDNVTDIEFDMGGYY